MLNFHQVSCLNTCVYAADNNIALTVVFRTSPRDMMNQNWAIMEHSKENVIQKVSCERTILYLKCRKPAHSSSVGNMLTNRRKRFIFLFLCVFEICVVHF